jgi:DNA (cytosine-5)-methyltransferase 1
VKRPRLLDLFCGAGGCSMGYHRAGFEVVGVDLRPQPRYPYEFIQGDAIDLIREIGAGFDAIHASPPCQAYSATRTIWNNKKDHPDLLAPTRDALEKVGRPWVIENVPGAPMSAHVTLCGSMFGLVVGEWELRRHRLFELGGFYVLAPPCRHRQPVLGVYGGHARDRRRTIGVYGHGGGKSMKGQGNSAPIAVAKEIMGIDWMTAAEISQAIPPAYTEFLGKHLLRVVESGKEAS